MFFTKFNPLTDEEVARKVDAQRRPAGGDCGILAGKSFKARLEGEFAPKQLDYVFKDKETLVCTENGEEYTAPYSAITLDHVTVFSHLVPGTTRGWHTVLDWRTNAITVFETWFGIRVAVGGSLFGDKEPDYYRDVPREIQRQYYFGWADFGDNEKPALNTTTNRIEGRGLYWKFCTGYEMLTFFPSVVCCTLVELGDKMGGITMANPADYLKIDDENYIFSRGEVEFSGKFWLEVMNFFEDKAIGLEFGFDEDDNFVYTLHTADIKITGDAAHLESIYTFGDKEPPMARLAGRKGGRYAYRPMDIDIPMSHEEALKHANEAHRIFEVDGPNIMASKNTLPFSKFLIGKKFKVKLDMEKHAIAPWTGDQSTVYEYDVFSERYLKYRENDGEWKEAKYICFEPAKDIYFFSHMVTDDPDWANLTHACDFSTGLTTTVRAQIGNWHSEWEIGSKVNFGTLEYGNIKPPFARRHHFTTDLVGKCFSWAYSDKMSSIHVYSSPESSSWTIFQGDNSGGATWSSPCYYIKLRDDAYIFEWVEENCNGMQGLVVINPKTLHDGGFFFGVGHNGLSLNITGAFGRELGTFDIKKYFDKTSDNI
ncbi:MAG: hypothetical protein IKN89_13475 [Oscillospiraceae bacterium]|nr:hypothetical protein [Oscillospiraceae bacterium]